MFFSATDPGSDSVDHWDIDLGTGAPVITVPGDATQADLVFADPAKDPKMVVTAVNEDGAFASSVHAVDVLSNYLRVTTLTPTATGFKARFNHAFEPGVINLYSGEPTNMGPADVLVSGAVGGNVRGSLVFDEDAAGFTFIKTGGLLAADTYTVMLRSGSNAFKDPEPTGAPPSDPLDGDNDDVLGGDYVGGFTVAASAVPVLSIPDFARGNLQSVDIPAYGSGLPIRLSDGAGVESISFTLRYRHDDTTVGQPTDPLLVSGLELPADLSAAGLPAGTTLSYDLTTPGVIPVTVSAPAGGNLGAGAKTLLIVRASVGGNAAYADKQVLDLSDITVTGAAGSALDDDGVQVVALLGDSSGNRGYSTLDVQRLQRVIVRYDTGFGAYPNADPVIIGDINASGTLTALDATRLLQEVNFVANVAATDRPEIAAIPAGVTPLALLGPDPTVDIARTFSAKPGETLTVPVRLDTTEGLDSVQLRLNWDATALELVDIGRGSVSGDFQWYLQRRGEGEMYVDMSRLQALTAGSGSLLELKFRVRADAKPGVVDLDLSWVSLNEGRLTLNPQPRAGRDGADGQVRIEALAPAVAKPGLLAVLAEALKRKLLGMADAGQAQSFAPGSQGGRPAAVGRRGDAAGGRGGEKRHAAHRAQRGREGHDGGCGRAEGGYGAGKSARVVARLRGEREPRERERRSQGDAAGGGEGERGGEPEHQGGGCVALSPPCQGGAGSVRERGGLL